VSGRLVLCATPIGNLGDVSTRLAEALESVDIVYAEDTRRSRVLLSRLGVDKPLRSYFVGNEESRAAELKERLTAGESAALITDAGMPSIADPGLTAVRAAVAAGAEVTIVPGPSAVTAALAVSGLPADRFAFEGFLPRKDGPRRRRVDALAGEARTMVFFATPSRVAADLATLTAVFGEDRTVVVARELTKAHEEIFRGSLAEATSRWSSEVDPRGEFTLVVAGAAEPSRPVEDLLPEVEEGVAAGGSLSEVVKDVAQRRGVSRRKLYEAALRDRDGA
jgi:16S rRNA (cytidine1402-2'-O)-methyltransferase